MAQRLVRRTLISGPRSSGQSARCFVVRKCSNDRGHCTSDVLANTAPALPEISLA